MERFVFFIENGGERADIFLSREIPGVSRNGVQKLMANGLVAVNGVNIKANYRLRPGDEVAAEVPPPVDVPIKPEDALLSILHEDSDLIVIEKPKGMVVHPAAGHYEGTLVNALMHHCAGGLSGINGELRPGIVHRIDKDTSGVIVAAKTNAAHISLARQLAAHSMTRVYYAIACGGIDKDGTVDKPIGRHPARRKSMAVNAVNGKPAVTHYKVLERLLGYTFIEARLETGRTHQIRVHMAHIGRPLLGDALYGGSRRTLPAEGQTLHAGVLGFVHPSTGRYVEFTSELPHYFTALLEKARRL